MRPVPTSKHWLAVIVFLCVAGVTGVVAFVDQDIATTQVNLATAAVKRHDPSLFAADPIFGGQQSGFWQFHTPLFQSILELVLVPTRYSDPTLPFRVLAPLAVLLYLGGMYMLLYRQTRSSPASIFTAVMSLAVIYTLGRSHWGLGSLASIDTESLSLALVPLAVLTYLNYRERRGKLVVLFAVIGFLGLLHPITAGNLALVLLIVHLGSNGFSRRAIVTVVACGAAAAVMAVPYVSYYLSLRAYLSAGAAEPNAEVIYEAFRWAKQSALYPDILKSLLEWDMLLRVLLLALVAAAVLSRLERFRTRDRSVWIWFIGAGVFVAMGLQGASQLVGLLRHQSPPIIDFYRAASLVLLPLYVLLAQGLTNLFRLVRRSRALVAWGCALLLVVWLMPSENMRAVRHAAYRAAAIAMPQRAQELREEKSLNHDLAAMGEWAQQNTDPAAIFLTNHDRFRMLSHRSVVALRLDAEYMYYLCPGGLESWMRRFNEQQRLLEPASNKADAANILRFARSLTSQPPFRQATQWYVVLSADTQVTPCEGWEAIPDQTPWGQSLRLYRIQPRSGQ